MLDFAIILLLRIALAVYSVYPLETIEIGNIGHPRSFIPSETSNDSEKIVSDLVFRKMFKYENGELINDLVESWHTNDEKTEYKNKLKENQRWQDGNIINANDIIYTITRYETLRNDLDIERLSEREVLIKVGTPNAILPTILTFGIEPSHLKNQSKVYAIGSTSFRVARVTKEQSKIESVVLISLKSDKQYNKVIVRFYDDENTLTTAYKLGELDIFLSSQDVIWDGLERVGTTFAGRQYAILINTNNTKLENAEVRKTLLNALDIEDLLKGNYYINAKPAQGPISYSKYTREEYKKSFHLPDAKLTPAQQAGIQQIKVLLPNNQDGRRIESFLNKYWQENLGIEVAFEYMSMEEIFDKTDGGNFDVIFIGYETSPDPDRYIYWHSTQANILNLSNFVDLRADRSLEEGRKFYNFEERKEHYDIFQDVFISKTPAIYLYHPGTYIYKQKKKEFPIPKIMYYPSDIVKNL